MRFFIITVFVVGIHAAGLYYFSTLKTKSERRDITSPDQERFKASNENKKTRLTKKPKTMKMNKPNSMSLSNLGVSGRVEGQRSKVVYKNNHKHIYCLPYAAGNTYMVTQGYNGVTHKDSQAYAIDFWIKEGESIHAIRSGTVIQSIGHFRDNSRLEESLMKGNLVVIEHDDGSKAMYGHLKFNGALVRVGKRVRTGQKVGLSGNTGLASSSGAHLHLCVFEWNAEKQSECIPISFITKKHSAVTLKAKEQYTSVRGCD